MYIIFSYLLLKWTIVAMADSCSYQELILSYGEEKFKSTFGHIDMFAENEPCVVKEKISTNLVLWVENFYTWGTSSPFRFSTLLTKKRGNAFTINNQGDSWESPKVHLQESQYNESQQDEWCLCLQKSLEQYSKCLWSLLLQIINFEIVLHGQRDQ